MLQLQFPTPYRNSWSLGHLIENQNFKELPTELPYPLKRIFHQALNILYPSSRPLHRVVPTSEGHVHIIVYQWGPTLFNSSFYPKYPCQILDTLAWVWIRPYFIFGEHHGNVFCKIVEFDRALIHVKHENPNLRNIHEASKHEAMTMFNLRSTLSTNKHHSHCYWHKAPKVATITIYNTHNKHILSLPTP